MANECCTNKLCIDRETHLRLSQIREQLLTNFNSLLVDRIRFLEQTIHQLSFKHPDQHTYSKTLPINRCKLSTIRRSSSATASFTLNSNEQNFLDTVTSVRSCPSSVNLSDNNNDQSKLFVSTTRNLQRHNRLSTEFTGNCLSILMHRQWTKSTNDLPTSAAINNDKGRLETRRFACDVDDNDVRVFKAMVYMEQARKQHLRPFTRLRQALGISTHNNSTIITQNSLKK